MRVPIAREGIKLAIPLLFLTVVLFWVHMVLFILSFACFVFVLAFFRDPVRKYDFNPHQVVSPADGKIIQIREIELESKSWRLLSIFMSIWNVHFNYAPMDGQIMDMIYKKGEFFRADLAKASDQNESNTLIIKNRNIEIRLKQIAGLVARRIVPFRKKGDHVKVGAKIGLIQFGSRVDLYLPKNVQLNVKVGDKVRGAYSILGVIS